MSKKQLSNQIKVLSEKKEQLLKLKASGQFTEQQQSELDSIVEELFDLNEQLNGTQQEQPAAEQEQPAAKPVQAKSVQAKHKSKFESALIKLKVQYGNRFSAVTGEEVNPPREVSILPGLWNAFKKGYKLNGFKIVEVIQDPTGEAEALVEK